MRHFIFLLAVFIPFYAYTTGDGDEEKKSRHSFVDFLHDYLTIKYEGMKFQEYLYVSIKQQRIFHISDKKVIAEYPVSTAINGVGNKNGSERTPAGLHKIQRKIGHDVPFGGIFINRSYSGKISEIILEKKLTGRDDVTSRILWLGGMEAGINKGGDFDSFERCIYIHGTPEEGFIGNPASHGCIRMKNQDVIELFNQVGEEMPVIILNN